MTKPEDKEVQILGVDTNGEMVAPMVKRQLGLFQGIVGGLIEPLSTKDWTMYINEEGKIYNLPMNEIATMIALKHKLISPHDAIVGNVFFVGPVNAHGYDTSLKESTLNRLISEGVYFKQIVDRYYETRFDSIVSSLQTEEME